MSTEQYIVNTLTNDLVEKHNQAILKALKRHLPNVQTPEQLLPYVEHITVSSRLGESEQYLFKGECFMTIYPTKVDVERDGRVSASFQVQYAN